jgi:MFS family permease
LRLSTLTDTGSRSSISVFLMSCAVIHLQLSLIRLFAVTHWHHFSYLVISTALLGYALSGSVLQLSGRWLRNHYSFAQYSLALGTALIGFASFKISQRLPIDSQYLFSSLDQLGLFAVYILLILIPFLLSAGSVGLALMYHPDISGKLYAFSLAGTATGGLFAILLMYHVAEESLCFYAFLIAALASAVWATRSWTRVALTFLAIIMLSTFVLTPTSFSVEPFKALARMNSLEQQGDATRLFTLRSPRGRLDVFSSAMLHYTLFAGVEARQGPPPQLCILRDGNFAGTVYKIHSADDGKILDYTPASLAYQLRPGARTLLLGETGGINVWLARRHKSREIVVVQDDPQVVEIGRDLLPEGAGRVFTGPDIRLVEEEPRLYLESTNDLFDIIQVVSAEEMAAETRGASGLSGDYLLTAEGLSTAFKRLAPDGILIIVRGIQVPPRDILKLATTMNTALEQAGVEKPAARIVIARNYLANLMLVFRKELTKGDLALLSSQLRKLRMDADWPRELIQSQEKQFSTEARSQLPSTVEALSRIFSRDSQFIREWMYDIRPATDDRPYFRDFFLMRSIGWMRQVYRDQWYLRVELGFAILLLVVIEVVALASLVLLVPAILWWRTHRTPEDQKKTALPLWKTMAYFLLIGTGFMALEINCIARAEMFLGDPVFSTTLVISILLGGAGIGSAVATRKKDDRRQLMKMLALILGCLILLLFFSTPALPTIASFPLSLRALFLSLILFPLGFALGFFFPLGLRRVQSPDASLVPWAWGANGFASVVGPPLVTAIGMSAGHRAVFLLAAACYLLAVVSLPPSCGGEIHAQ